MAASLVMGLTSTIVSTLLSNPAMARLADLATTGIVCLQSIAKPVGPCSP